MFVDPWGWIKWGAGTDKLKGEYIATKHGAAKVTAIEALEKASGRTVTVTADPSGINNYDSYSRTVNISGATPQYRSGDELITTDIREIVNHELDHALYHLGTDSGGFAKAQREIPADPMYSVLERHAIEDTNLLRKELGRKPRTKYSREPGQWIRGVKWPAKSDGYGGYYDDECQ